MKLTASSPVLGVAKLSLELETELEDEEDPTLRRAGWLPTLALLRGVPAWVGGVGSGRPFFAAAT